MKTVPLLLLLLLMANQVLASHLLGGYIRATSTGGLRYEVTVTLYKDGMNSSSGADDAVSLCFGDGTTQQVLRQSYIISNDRRYSISTYRAVHTYAGPATYRLVATQATRTRSRNITGPENQQVFTLATTFITSGNQTPTLSYPATELRIGVNQRATVSLKAADTDGDSLAYQLALPLVELTRSPCIPQNADGHQYPNDLTRRGTFRLDRRTGELVWDAPTEVGNYTVAIRVDEYRQGILISQTTQEMLLLVEDRAGPPGLIPPYQPAATTGLVTANSPVSDEDITLTVFPNPVDDRLEVVLHTSNPATARMRLTDSNGRTLYEMAFGRPGRRHEQVINMDSLAPGLYVLRAEVSGRTLVRKIVKH